MALRHSQMRVILIAVKRERVTPCGVNYESCSNHLMINLCLRFYHVCLALSVCQACHRNTENPALAMAPFQASPAIASPHQSAPDMLAIRPVAGIHRTETSSWLIVGCNNKGMERRLCKSRAEYACHRLTARASQVRLFGATMDVPLILLDGQTGCGQVNNLIGLLVPHSITLQ